MTHDPYAYAKHYQEEFDKRLRPPKFSNGEKVTISNQASGSNTITIVLAWLRPMPNPFQPFREMRALEAVYKYYVDTASGGYIIREDKMFKL